MSIFLFNGFLLLCFVVTTVPDVLVRDSSGPVKFMSHRPTSPMCSYSRDNSLLKARCLKLKSHEIPLDLKTDIQVLHLTWNQVTKLKNDSLQPYKNLAFIYLSDNFISEIEEAAFANQPYLQVLDLSQNFCNTLPKSLLQLPHLHSLYLGHNMLTDSVFKVKVTSPLRVLELNRNWLTVIPNIGVQPTLLNLNLSDNEITSISTEDLAPFCSLKELDLSRNRIRFNASSCDCQTFSAWVKLRQIKIKPDHLYECTDSPAQRKACANVRFSDRTYELFNECSPVKQQEMETVKSRSVWIYSVLVLFIVVFVALLCVHKRNRRRRRRSRSSRRSRSNRKSKNSRKRDSQK